MTSRSSCTAATCCLFGPHAQVHIKPHINSVAMSVGTYDPDFIRACKELHVTVLAYTPQRKSVDFPAVKQIAEELGKSPAQVALRFLAQVPNPSDQDPQQRGIPFVTFTSDGDHASEIMDVDSFELSDEQFATLAAIKAG
jgi:2,5-diketo-D-gluconate reductase A